MRQALFTLVVGVAGIASASASVLPYTAPAESVAHTAASLKLQTRAEIIETSASASPTSERSGVPGTAVEAPSKPAPDSGWQSLGTLLATWVLIGAIAVRRNQSGRS